MKATCASVGFLLALAIPTASAAPPAAPGAPGPFGVGETLLTGVVMSGGRVTRIQVFYPTLAPKNCAKTYTVLGPTGAPLFEVPSTLCAVQDAPVAPGPFPLLVYDHGGGSAGADTQRLAQLPVHELLASHGFVVAVSIHSADSVARVRDLPLVIDLFLAKTGDAGDRFFGSVDPDRIGLGGFSAGGFAAITTVSGWSDRGIAPETRVKALFVYEGGLGSSPADTATISIPYLRMAGTQGGAGATGAELLALTPDAEPRIGVIVPDALHFNFQTELCAFIEGAREAAFAANPALADPGTPELLTTQDVATPAASFAFTQWNVGQFQVLGFGGGRNMCTHVGLGPLRSLDVAPRDGLTDTPPLRVLDPAVGCAPADGGAGNVVCAPGLSPRAAPPAEVTVPVVQHYTVAFLKAFLEGDRGYMRYLTPGHANVNDLPVVVTIP